MKITLDKNNQTVNINCADISDEEVRRLLDVLLAPQQPSAEVRVEAVGPAAIPVDIEEYQQWLYRASVHEALPALSQLAGYSLDGNVRTAYGLLNAAPQFATNLGMWRYIATVEWLYQCGLLNNVPTRDSLRKYYNSAARRTVQ